MKKYEKINIDHDLIKNDFNKTYSPNDRQMAIIMLVKLQSLEIKENIINQLLIDYSTTNNLLRVFNSLTKIQKTIKSLIYTNKEKALEAGKAKIFKSKSYLIFKKGKLDLLKNVYPEYFKKTTRNIFKYL